MNPYASYLESHASYLESRDPVTVIAATPSELGRALDAIGPERAAISPAPGKWSARDILCHLADTELVFAFRLRQSLAQDHHVIQPFDQDAWAKAYKAFDAGSAVAMFAAVRSWNLTLIRGMEPSDTARPVKHPERGTMTVQTIIETMAGHDLNHLGQLNAIAGR